jgi:RNA polymerase sigma factor (sigma-70 family)
MQKSDVEKVIQEIKNGNDDFLTKVFKTYAKYCIDTLVSKRKCPRQQAEDIYIDAVMNLRDKLLSGKIEVLTDTRSYLYATCNNMFLVSLKKDARVNIAALEMYGGEYAYGDDSDAEEYFQELHQITADALASLKDGCRDLLKSFYYDRLSMEEIAKQFSFVNTNVAKVAKSRCFQKLLNSIRTLKTGKL